MGKTPSHKRGSKTRKNDLAKASTKSVLRRSTRLHGVPATENGSRSISSMSKKTLKEVIEISSSNQHNVFNDFSNEKDSEGPISAQTPPKDNIDNASQSPIHEKSDPMVAQPTEKDVLDEKVSRIGTSVEYLTFVVNGLTAFFNHNTVGQVFPNSSGIPLIFNTFLPPFAYSVDSKKGTIPLQATETPNTMKIPLTSNSTKTAEKEKILKHGSTTKKNLFSKPNQDNNTSYYMNLQPLHSEKFDGRTEGVCIPWWIPVLFRPPTEMILDEIEAHVAAYIFGLKYDEDLDYEYEVLVTSRVGIFGERCRVKTPMPRQRLHQDVLNLVVAMVIDHARANYAYSIFWFLPTDFSRYCLAWMKPPSAAMTSFKDDYMEQPLVLVVADMRAKKLILLDSAPCVLRNEARKLQAKKMAVYLEEMFDHDSFYEFSETDRPTVTEFPLVIPTDIGKQAAESNDCGVWVCKWMTDYTLTDNYNIKVDRVSCMRLAIDLLIKPYNIKKDQVVSVATQAWKELHKDKKA
ncbi:Papain-like cysteine peptidase superfamily [Sesbania bispinosa]|nr:Papain-like cysteine peptidase superfamily [Sesbania bispinosa]